MLFTITQSVILLQAEESPANSRYCSSCDIQFATRRAWTRHILTSPAHIQLAVHTLVTHINPPHTLSFSLFFCSVYHKSY